MRDSVYTSGFTSFLNDYIRYPFLHLGLSKNFIAKIFFSKMQFFGGKLEAKF